MKNNLLLAMIFCVTSLLAQNKVGEKVFELQRLKAIFKPISILTSSQDSNDEVVNKVVDGATLATLNFDKINEIVSGQIETIELQIPYQNQNIALLLYKVNPFADGFHVDTDKGKNFAYVKGVYYRGIIKGKIESVSAFNFFNGEFNGIISSAELGNVVVGKLNKLNNQSDYIVYSDAKMKVLNEFECHTKEEGVYEKSNTEVNRNVNTDKCVTFYFEVDNDLFLSNNSNITSTTNWMTSLYNNVQTLFTNDGITTALQSIFIWTELDPYNGISTSSGTYLSTFRNTRTVFDGDVGHLVGIDPGGLGGVAYLNSVCNSFNYAYSDVNFTYATVPTYSWTVNVLTHEFGHSLGSPHTHRCSWFGTNNAIDGCGTQAGYPEGSCPIGPIPDTQTKGTIMSYCHLISGVGINFANGFGQQPAELLIRTVNNKPCISSNCINGCLNTITDILITNITNNSALITWNSSVPSSNWQLSITPFSVTTPEWVNLTTNSYLAIGLTSNTYYNIRVRPLCDGTESINREKTFATNPTNFCATVPFTDTGGASGNYSNIESWTRTMTPNNPGLKIRISFSSFNLENNNDYLYIYNGPDDTYPDLTNGGLTGNTNPGMFNSTAFDGSLTVKFFSDQEVVAAGWNGFIICTGTLGIEDADFLDYSYYPNPTTGIVAIKSKDIISEVAVYNVQGQLLFNQKLNELSTNVDISQFSKGTYFFKLKINDTEANFKILKM